MPARSRSNFHRICSSIPSATGSMPKVNKICICAGFAVPEPIFDRNPHKPHQKMHSRAYHNQVGTLERSVIPRRLGFLTQQAVLVLNHVGADPECVAVHTSHTR